MDYEAQKIAIEQAKLDLEKIKLASEEAREKEKLASEEKRAKWTAISVSISIVVPLIAVFVTVIFGFLSARKQAESQFKLEIAKAIMSAPTIAEGFDRVRLVKGFFPTEPMLLWCPRRESYSEQWQRTI